jgi:hypothetical protein
MCQFICPICVEFFIKERTAHMRRISPQHHMCHFFSKETDGALIIGVRITLWYSRIEVYCIQNK